MSKTWEEHQKTAPFKKYSWVLSDVVSTQRDSTKSDMAAKKKKKKKKDFLLDYKFIKYTLHRFLLLLACKTGRPGAGEGLCHVRGLGPTGARVMIVSVHGGSATTAHE